MFYAHTERPATDRRLGLSEAVLRIPENHPNIFSVLNKSFAKLFGLYAGDRKPPSFDVTITANLVLYSRSLQSYSFYFGQDFSSSDGKSSLVLSSVYQVDALSDIAGIPAAVSSQEFGEAFDRIFADTDVTVHSIAALVYIIRKLLPDFQRDSVVGNKLTKLF